MSAGFDMSAAEYAVSTSKVLPMSSRIAAICVLSPKPFSITGMPCAANARAMPRPMPLVEPVTMATRPANSRPFTGSLS